MLNAALKPVLAALSAIALLLASDNVHADNSFSSLVPNLQTMLLNFGQSVPNLMRLVTAGAYVLGMFIIIASIMGMKHFGELRMMMSREHGILGPLVGFFVGVSLLYLPSTVGSGLNTFWQTTNPYAYVTSTTGVNATFINTVFSIVQLIGTIAFIRGLLMLKQAGSERGGQPGLVGKATAHLVGGILCINIYNTIKMLEKTIGIVT